MTETRRAAQSHTYGDAGVRVLLEDDLLTVTLCRPDSRNAQTPAMWAALAEIGDTLPEDVAVVVLRAEGPSFSAGLDHAMFETSETPEAETLAELAALDDRVILERIATFQEAFSWWRRAEIVTIAAVQGHAVGAGFQLALACDFRILADDTRFYMRETSLGLVPDLGGTKTLVSAVGYSRALEICATGRWVDANEALLLGLATIVVPSAELDDTVSDLVSAVTAAPRHAVTATKGLLQTAAGRSHVDQLAAERAAQVRMLRASAWSSGTDGHRTTAPPLMGPAPTDRVGTTGSDPVLRQPR